MKKVFNCSEFIRKEIISYKIHNLGSLQTYDFIYYGSAKQSKALEQIWKEVVRTLPLLKLSLLFRELLVVAY